MADRGTGPRRSRRDYLASIGAGATGLLAGCTEFAQRLDTPADRGTVEELEGAASVLHWSYLVDLRTDDDPRKMTWFGTGAFPGPSEPIGPRGGYHRPRPMWDMTMALEVWGGWLDDFVKTGAIEYGLYESVDVEPDRVELTVRADARWSNGDDILGRDAVPVLMAARMTDNAATPPDELPPGGPSTPLDAVTDFEWDGKTATLHSDGGWFDDFLDERVCASLARKGAGWGGIWQHTRIPPYDEWFETIADHWERAVRGELDPWADPVPVYRRIRDTVHTENDEWERHFQAPANCVVSGAFRPAEIRNGGDVVLEPNPEFYAAERVDVDAILVTRVPQPDISRSLLQDDELDYYRGLVRAPYARSLPDTIEERTAPAPGGLAVAVNHGHRWLGRRAVRRALLLAVDAGRIAETIHETRFEPVTTPGGDAHRTRHLLGDDFVDDALTSYERDRDAAAALLEDAGFEREDEQWVDPAGEPLSFDIATVEPFLDVGRALQTQLGDFGIQLSGRNLQPADLGRAIAEGNLDIWTTSLGTGFARNAVGDLYYRLVAGESAARNGHAVFPAEQVSAVEYDDGRIRADGPDDLDAFALEAPPVGEPDGDRQTWHPPKLALQCVEASTREEYVAALRKLAWLYNWHLPVLPFAHARTQHFLDTVDFDWPDLADPSRAGVGAGAVQPEDLVALGLVARADDGTPVPTGTDVSSR